MLNAVTILTSRSIILKAIVHLSDMMLRYEEVIHSQMLISASDSVFIDVINQMFAV